MLYTEFQDKKLSMLGFGAMRLPEVDGQIDRTAVKEMVDYAIEHGVNYFDTAWPYHAGMSERVMGEMLSAYPRESYFLADKYPGHQIMQDMNPEHIFEEQLRRCKTEYFDFYLLLNNASTSCSCIIIHVYIINEINAFIISIQTCANPFHTLWLYKATTTQAIRSHSAFVRKRERCGIKANCSERKSRLMSMNKSYT